MTTIIWDGKTLVGDKQATYGTTAVLVTKVFKVCRNKQTFLFGCSGDSDQCKAYSDWAHALCDKPEFTDLQIICINQQKEIFVTNQRLLWSKINKPYWAIGSGCDYAIAAMACGKTAEVAMAIATSLDIYTGLGFDKVTL